MDDAATQAKLGETAELQAEIWTLAASAVQREGVPPSTMTLVIGALNEMIDITATRTMATRSHPPAVVFLLLVAMSLLCALLVGYATSQNAARSWLHTLTFAAVISLTVYVIIDLEFPRVGLIRVDSADEMLRQVRESMR
jgi:TRAP-type C4-dicarboxylate transport system permease large subunit